MLAQRGQDLDASIARQSAAKPVRAAVPAPPPAAPPKARLSFREKHALETLPNRIEVLQAEIATLQETLGDPTLYGRDPTKFQRASERLTTAETALEQLEDEWLALEMKREEIERDG
jgi:ATP-binding cassette subfamily F protein uup